VICVPFDGCRYNEIKAHLLEFGIDEELATGKVKRMSGGQKSRLVLAAAMWNKPHLIALDEPTNYLDNETLSVLTASLKSFRGGVVTVSHHEDFVRELCTELWHVGGVYPYGTGPLLSPCYFF
jgi:ATPase subunit of ABC transporter with duplicated ATPase domains